MTSAVTEIAATLLILTCVVQGIQSLEIDHKASLNAAVGQDISLPCIVAENEANINQIQWNKKTKNRHQPLVVFNPAYPINYIASIKLELVNNLTSTKPQGSILHLHNVTEEDSGIYVCDITTFPEGSIESSTILQVTEPWISAEVMPPSKSLIEGDEVNITCVSNPSADRYILLSLQSGLTLESQSGQFAIQNVTRHSSELICRPHWTSSNQKFLSLQGNLRITVDFIDNIECNCNSQLEVKTGTNLTITCKATSSRPLRYVWMKGNMSVSQNDTISLWSVNPDHSGMYSVIVNARNHSRLQRQRDFQVTVLNRTDAEHIRSTIIMETMSQTMGGTTPTTAGPGTTEMTMTQPGHTSSTAHRTTMENNLYYNTTAPSTGNITTLQARITIEHENITTVHENITTEHKNITTVHENITTEHENITTVHENITTEHKNITTAHVTVKSNATWSYSLNASAEGSTQSEGCCQAQNTTSNRSISEEINIAQPVTSTTIFVSTSTLVTLNKAQSGSITVAVFIPMLLLLVLIGFLYRRYLIQRRMDMPPPFKPPPPPVKYTSVRSQDIPVTDV